jgi:hypothetical protein
MDFVAAPHERWAELAKRMHDPEHAGDDTAGILIHVLSIAHGMMRSALAPRTSRS